MRTAYGQPVELARLAFALLIVGSMLFAFGQEIGIPITDQALNETSKTQATDGINYMQTIWNHLTLVFLLLGGVGLVAHTVYRSP